VGVVDYARCELWDGIEERVARLAGAGSDSSGNAGGRVSVGAWMLGVVALVSTVLLA
jgi:hypothetical protein